MWSQIEAGHTCPISMTYAAVPALRHNSELAAKYEPLLAAPEYDYGLREPSTKRGLIAGMSMTEKQGGSDVRANTTTARPDGDGTYRIVGHKWFTSAPMSDVFLTLAQEPGGLSCFLLPRVLPDGTRNPIRLQRLKDKLGNRSNASSEIEYENAVGWLVGEEGRGVRTIIEMVNNTRLDCAVGSAAGMRAATVQAVHHATHRHAFGKALDRQPLMANVLADLVVESEAATTVGMRLAGATGRPEEQAFRRLGLAVTKYWVCKRAPSHAAEALECLGGNGYVEESGMPRLYREAPLMSIWEGSGNVAALDALRAMAKQPDTVDAFFTEVELATGADSRLDDAHARLRKDLSDLADIEYRARRIVESMAMVLQGSLLVRFGTPRSPTRSARRGSVVTGVSPSARSRPVWTPRRSSTGQGFPDGCPRGTAGPGDHRDPGPPRKAQCRRWSHRRSSRRRVPCVRRRRGSLRRRAVGRRRRLLRGRRPEGDRHRTRQRCS